MAESGAARAAGVRTDVPPPPPWMTVGFTSSPVFFLLQCNVCHEVNALTQTAAARVDLNPSAIYGRWHRAVSSARWWHSWGRQESRRRAS